MNAIPYLNFDGRCDEALEFYQKALGAEIKAVVRYKDAPPPGPPNIPADKVMHAEFRVGNSTLFASDCFCAGKAAFQGISISLTMSDDSEAWRLFAALSDGGNVQMPMATTFFASRFGQVVDRFGLSWM